MKPIKFLGCNVTFGEGQKEYHPLPAILFPDGQVITCWELTQEEINLLIQTGRIYLSQYTYNKPLQPILPMIELGDDIGLV